MGASAARSRGPTGSRPCARSRAGPSPRAARGRGGTASWRASSAGSASPCGPRRRPSPASCAGRAWSPGGRGGRGGPTAPARAGRRRPRRASCAAASARRRRASRGPPTSPSSDRPPRQGGLPVGRQGPPRLLGRGVEGRRAPGRRAGQLDARGRLRPADARRAPRHPLRPRRPLPLARLGLDLREQRPHQEHARQGPQPGQRRDGGPLRPAQEGAPARRGLVGPDPRPPHRGARGPDRPLRYGEAQRRARRPHAGRVPRRAGGVVKVSWTII